MPAYNFQSRFAAAIWYGSKWHTIRMRRKRPTVAGDTLYLYTGLRTKKAKLIKQTPCLKVEPIQVLRGVGVVLNGVELTEQQTVDLALHDGFSGPWEFFDFFDRYPYEVLSTKLELIHWRLP